VDLVDDPIAVGLVAGTPLDAAWPCWSRVDAEVCILN